MAIKKKKNKSAKSIPKVGKLVFNNLNQVAGLVLETYETLDIGESPIIKYYNFKHKRTFKVRIDLCLSYKWYFSET